MSPAGYCRDLFLHVKDEYLIELKSILQEKLQGVASKAEMEIPFLFYMFK
ncbi:hypothetical protein [Clostridium sp. KNHs214]|nr:hypothetical protein [Clostridium sp. KNHs214]